MTSSDRADDPPGAHRPGRRIALNTAIFSIGTGLSRVAGLVREIVASSYFGTSGPFSAFTIAFQVPNLLRSLVADAALSAAFVPVFTELLEKGRKRDAFQLASTLFFLILIALGAITALFIVFAGTIMPAFTGDEFTRELDQLTVGLSRVLFPIVVILGLNGLVVGILYAYDHFTIPALAPLVWNVVIIVLLVVLKPAFEGPDEMYAYAIGVLAGTAVQFAMALPILRRMDFRLEFAFRIRDERVRRVLALMLPVTIGLGVINFSLLINSTLGSLVSEQAPRAIDAAFRIYMLPQGVFSIALATVLFPTLSRLAARQDFAGMRRTMGSGVRQIFLTLIPASIFTLVLAEPITRLVYERGSFGPGSTEQVAEALLWFSAGLPFAGVNLLLTRTFFALQRPWRATAIAVMSLLVNVAVSVALYKPFGIAGIVIGTAVANAAMTAGQAIYLRADLQGSIEGARTIAATFRILAASGLMAGVGWLTWWGLDEVLGRSTPGQIVSVGSAVLVGTAIYAVAVLAMRIPEAHQLWDFVTGRLRRRPPTPPPTL